MIQFAELIQQVLITLVQFNGGEWTSRSGEKSVGNGISHEFDTNCGNTTIAIHFIIVWCIIISNITLLTRFECKIATNEAIGTILVSIERRDSVLSNDGRDA